MKQLFFIAAMLFSITATAQQQTFVKSVSTNYAKKQVTFNISWANGTRNIPGTSGTNRYNSRVWVFVDYQEVKNGQPVGNWTRADVVLSSLTHTNCTADGTNTNGFWYQGATTVTQNENITITLANTLPAQFKWCAFATDCPPRAMYNNGTYTLKGTPPFEITYIGGSTTTDNKIFRAGTITAITDATKCPGYVQYPYINCNASNINLGTVGFTSSSVWVVGAQTWSAPVTVSYCNKSTINSNSTAVVDCRAGTLPQYGHYFTRCMMDQYFNDLCPKPWRVPTRQEFIDLDKGLGYTGVARNIGTAVVTRYTSELWGGYTSGRTNGSAMSHEGTTIRYWFLSASTYAASSAGMMNCGMQGSPGVRQWSIEWEMDVYTYAYPLRCVQ